MQIDYNIHRNVVWNIFYMVKITNFVTVQTFLGISSTHNVAKVFTSGNCLQK
jgi:hypothetical protein